MKLAASSEFWKVETLNKSIDIFWEKETELAWKI